MRVVNFKAENYQIIKAIEITPDGNVVTIGGKNGQGKSSILDAIWVTLAGRAVAPAKPIRAGEEQCRLRLDLGELVVTRSFTDKGEGRITDTVKVQSADGKTNYNSPQTVLNELMGQLGFDPFAFVQMKPDDQAETLLGMVALPIDLEGLAAEDQADYDARRIVNRDVESLKARFEAIAVPDDLPADAPDRNALADRLANAAETNGAIERERMARAEELRSIEYLEADAEASEADIVRLRAEIEKHERSAAEDSAKAAQRREALTALPPLDEPVDTATVRAELAAADEISAALARKAEREKLEADHKAKVAESERLTKAMADREAARRKALAEAQMPIGGLGFAVNERGKPVVMFGEAPFAQASTADQIRASTAIAMAGNPDLRVLRIKDGSLLDDDSMAIIAQMAKDEDFQLWVERVGTEGVGIVIENGEIKAASAKPESGAEKPKAAAAGEEKANDGKLL